LQALEDLYVHYDETVRNAAGGIVQFSYGDDGMDPVVMEGRSGQPLDFERLLAKVVEHNQLSVVLNRSLQLC
jgi:DNA-directed RNA polymerase III subunit RPC1